MKFLGHIMRKEGHGNLIIAEKIEGKGVVAKHTCLQSSIKTVCMLITRKREKYGIKTRMTDKGQRWVGNYGEPRA